MLGLKNYLLLILLGIFEYHLTITIEEKCFNQKISEYTKNRPYDYLFPYGGINFNKDGNFNYGDKVQILSKHVYLNKEYKFFDRSLIYKGNSTTWKTNAIGAKFFPVENKINCQEKLKCNNEETSTKICKNCSWYGNIISDMSICVDNLNKYKGDSIKFSELCLNITSIPTPKASTFRNFSSYEKWDFYIVSLFGLVVVDSTKLDDCEKINPSVQNFICYDVTSTNPDRSYFYKFDYNGNFVKDGQVASSILGQDGLYEDNYSTLKMFSPGIITIDGKDYYIVDYYGLNWVNSEYLTDCSNINPVGPSPVNPSQIDPSPVDPKPSDKSDLSGFQIFLIVLAILAVVGSLVVVGVYYIRKRRALQTPLLN